jgi:hypothetical protein
MADASIAFESKCDYLENNSIDVDTVNRVIILHKLESGSSNGNSSSSSHDNSSQKPLIKQKIVGTASNPLSSNSPSIQPQKLSKKRKLVIQLIKSAIELGEEIDKLPYERPSRRGKQGVLLPPKNDIKPSSDRNIIKGNAPNILASKRIIDSFNIGDSDGIKEIIDNSIAFDCDVNVFPINHHLKGQLALLDVWESMIEIFPDGVFRASDTIINDKGELITRFQFSGTRQFDFVLGLEGGDVEVGETTSKNDDSFGDNNKYSSDNSPNLNNSQTHNNTIRYIIPLYI